MPSYNRVTLVGRLGQDPELKYTPDGKPICTFSLAVDRYAKAGEEPKVDWLRVQAWERQAESVAQYLVKGSVALVEGRLNINQWTTPEGEKKSMPVIQANQVVFLDSKRDREAREMGGGGSGGAGETDIDDLPF